MKKQKITGNYLEKIPVRSEHIGWSQADDGRVTLDIENKGLFNRIAQKLFKKPRVSHIHLDSIGSFVWPLIDGERSIMAIGEIVEEGLGERAQPTYERLAKFFQILDSYGFIKWKEI